MTLSHSPADGTRVALVTGAAGIIGPEIIKVLRAAGWRVAAAEYARANFDLYRKLHGIELEADLLLTGDLAQRNQCIRLVQETTEQLGPIGLLVNNATANTQSKKLLDLDESFVEHLLHVDLLAPLYLSQAAAPGLTATKGLIVNMSSVRVKEVLPGNLLYTVAKAGIEKMTEALAVELAPFRVRVNAIRIGALPGSAFLRPAMDLLSPELAKQLHADIMPRHHAHCAHFSLTGRVGIGSDVGNMIAYLASPAGEFINGAVVPVDGGFLLSDPANMEPEQKGPDLSALWAHDPRGQLKNWLREKGINYEF